MILSSFQVLPQGANPRQCSRWFLEYGQYTLNYPVHGKNLAHFNQGGRSACAVAGDIDKDASVLVSVRRLTDNGFTEEFEDGVLKAEEETEGKPLSTC